MYGGQCGDCLDRNNKSYKRRLRFEVIAKYGGMCRCCGEDNLEFLVIDHVNGGGNQERMDVGGGYRLYRLLRDREYSEDYQVLCCNCNHAKAYSDVCPHQATAKSLVG